MLLVGKEKGYILLIPLYTVFMHSIKRFRYKIEMQFCISALAVQQNNYTTKARGVLAMTFLEIL